MTLTHQEHGSRGYIEDQRAFFDKVITRDWHLYDNKHWNRTRVLEVRELQKLVRPCENILDVGCGDGFHGVEFARDPLTKRVVGIDNSEKSIEQANRNWHHPKVERGVADIFQANQIQIHLL